MSAKAISVEAARLLANPSITLAISQRRAVARDETQVDANDIAEELKRIGFASLADIGTWSKDGFILKDSSDLSPEVAAAVSEIQEIRHRDGSRGVKVKLHDKLVALDKLAKLLGYYRDDKQDRETRPINITRIVIQFPDGRTEAREIKPRGPVVEGRWKPLPEESEDSPS